jgi:hypothetical protein
VRAQSEGDVQPDADPIGLDIDKLTATARSLATQLLPGT